MPEPPPPPERMTEEQLAYLEAVFGHPDSTIAKTAPAIAELCREIRALQAERDAARAAILDRKGDYLVVWYTYRCSRCDGQRAKKSRHKRCTCGGYYERRLLPMVERMLESRALPVPILEYRFHPTRLWRFDWAFPDHDPPTALEIDGGLFTHGAHVRGRSRIQDNEKRNRATLMGWRVLVVSPDEIQSGEAFALLKEALHD